ncbi:hypothetical protein U9M48_005961 [Paspalum notatum var. saurae]|uniref:C2 domain-containing protein n=1 Tax=Paspalum notatum var. saurae TaxID=547442 RepID=A0AAQ3PR78_PASNO
MPPGTGAIGGKGRHAEIFAKVQVGGMVLRTRPCTARSPTSLAWNEELVFAVAEPFGDPARGAHHRGPACTSGRTRWSGAPCCRSCSSRSA